MLDRFPNLRLLLAHSGGALPQLSSRIASCIAHDPAVASRLKHDARAYLGKRASSSAPGSALTHTCTSVYFDSVNYGSAELSFVADVIARGKEYLGESVDRYTGSDRLLWGTDHPFFPPLEGDEKWRSVVENLNAIDELKTWDESQKAAVRGGNAIRLFNLDPA